MQMDLESYLAVWQAPYTTATLHACKSSAEWATMVHQRSKESLVRRLVCASAFHDKTSKEIVSRASADAIIVFSDLQIYELPLADKYEAGTVLADSRGYLRSNLSEVNHARRNLPMWVSFSSFL